MSPSARGSPSGLRPRSWPAEPSACDSQSSRDKSLADGCGSAAATPVLVVTDFRCFERTGPSDEESRRSSRTPKRNRGGAIHGKDGRTFQPMASDWTDDRHVRSDRPGRRREGGRGRLPARARADAPEPQQRARRRRVTREQVIKVNVYLADLADWSALNGPYAEFFGSSLPARTAFAASALPFGARVEIEAWAVVEETR